MMTGTLTRKLTLTTAAAALALGGAACELDENGSTDDVVEEPLLDDGSAG